MCSALRPSHPERVLCLVEHVLALDFHRRHVRRRDGRGRLARLRTARGRRDTNAVAKKTARPRSDRTLGLMSSMRDLAASLSTAANASCRRVGHDSSTPWTNGSGLPRRPTYDLAWPIRSRRPVWISHGAERPRRLSSHLALPRACVLMILVPPRTLAQTTGCERSEPEVATVTFAGNKAVPSQTLEAAVETAPSSGARRFTRLFGTRRCLAQGALLRDVARLMLFYRRKGYPRATVDTTVDRAPSRAVHVRFRIREHEPMVVDSVEIRGVPDSAMRARLRRYHASSGRPARSVFARRVECRDRGGAASGRLPGGDGARGERADSARRRAVAWIDVTMGTRVRLGEVRVDARGLDSSEPRIPARACRAPNAAPAGQRAGHTGAGRRPAEPRRRGTLRRDPHHARQHPEPAGR